VNVSLSRALASMHGKGGRVGSALVALALLVTVFSIAGPSEVLRLLANTDLRWISAAAAVALATALVRGVRLAMLLPTGRLGMGQAAVVAVAAQAATVFVPFRLGELALVWLLRRCAGWNEVTGLGTLLALRAIDLATLGVWVLGSVIVLKGFDEPVVLTAAVVLLAPVLLLPTVLKGVDALAVRLLAPRGARLRRWARRLRRLHLSLEEVRRRPRRLVAAVLMSTMVWGGIWTYTWLQLYALGYSWPPDQVVLGAAAASLTSLIPVNLFGNLGTLEVGWTAAFTALGVPLDEAAASGLAAHLWGLVFVAVFGAVAWALLARRLPSTRRLFS